MALHIISPEGTVLEAQAELVSLPGSAGPFTVLKDHAPIVTALDKGRVRYIADGKEQFVAIKEGFAEVKNNVVTVCAEV
ncbi:MAG: ATP synthase F1 subunit epsilon [Bacteroidales bacterium]|nr:ATP synthase F1 subunit epsilon [Bacteroidales bacterium]MBP5675841.1 ATP synthase F1 subunit epsilon [Bacteroidales bacterium]